MLQGSEVGALQSVLDRSMLVTKHVEQPEAETK